MRSTRHEDHATLMTEGSITHHLIAFAMPLMLGNLFQQLYNTADSVIVGNFLGSNALAAVSSSSSIIHLLIGFFNGVAGGAGVVIARRYGARDVSGMQKAIHTLIAFGIAAGLLLTALGVGISPLLLRLMGTPDVVLPQSISYFRVYFFGSLAFVLYNICMGILQAVGDSRHPLYYLMISSGINVALDLLFVGVLHWGVASAAAATALSQVASTVPCMIRLIRSDRDYRVNVRKIRFDRPALREILSNGLPSGMSNSIIAVANVVVQSNINAFGPAAMAGCGAHTRIEGFAFLPITCFNMALTTFVSQNLGAHRTDRVKKGIRVGLGLTVGLAEAIAVIIYAASPVLIGLFDRSPDVIAYGVMHERTIVLFYCLLAYTHAMAAICRGAGKATVPMLAMAVCWCVIRVPYVTIATHIFPTLRAVSWSYPITWALSSVVFTIYYFKSGWSRGVFQKAE